VYVRVCMYACLFLLFLLFFCVLVLERGEMVIVVVVMVAVDFGGAYFSERVCHPNGLHIIHTHTHTSIHTYIQNHLPQRALHPLLQRWAQPRWQLLLQDGVELGCFVWFCVKVYM
jgi:hypothetical protein